MADDTSDGTPPTSSPARPPARRTRRSPAAAATPSIGKRKPGPKPGSTRRPRQPQAAASAVTAAVAPKVRKATHAVKAKTETVTRTVPKVKARATRTIKKTATRIDKATASPMRNGILLGAAAAVASVVAGVFAFGRGKKPETKHPAKPSEPKPTTSAD